jgi:hypothetical protein
VHVCLHTKWTGCGRKGTATRFSAAPSNLRCSLTHHSSFLKPVSTFLRYCIGADSELQFRDIAMIQKHSLEGTQLREELTTLHLGDAEKTVTIWSQYDVSPCATTRVWGSIPPTSTNVSHYNIITYLPDGGIIPPTPASVTPSPAITANNVTPFWARFGHSELSA